MVQSRPFITCHVLDTVAGKPAANIAVTLRLLAPTQLTTAHWTGTTNADGRVTQWTSSEDLNLVVERARKTLSSSSPPSSTTAAAKVTAAETASETTSETVSETIKNTDEETSPPQMIWTLTFATEPYFGRGKTFWPEIELRFAASVGEEHYHVPLLLGPWSYTTYRGS